MALLCHLMRYLEVKFGPNETIKCKINTNVQKKRQT